MSDIVVGVDGSEASKAALRWAVEEARLRGVGVRAVHAWPRPMAVADIGAMRASDLEELRQAGGHLLDETIAGVEIGGVRVERVSVLGSPAPMLIEAAAGADLLVVGSRGHGGFVGLLLGSVSQQVAHHAPCPVVIVRDGAAT